MTQPLALPEVRELEQLRRQIAGIEANPFEDVVITVDTHSREKWLNIVDLAISANEELTDKWRESYENRPELYQHPK